MDSLRLLLNKAIEMIDAGECPELSQQDLDTLSTIIHQPKSYGRESASQFLGLSLNRFHELRNSGIIRDPRKVAGLKEKQYYLADLKEAKERIPK